DDEFEFRWLFNGKVGGLGALEELVDVDGGPMLECGALRQTNGRIPTSNEHVHSLPSEFDGYLRESLGVPLAVPILDDDIGARGPTEVTESAFERPPLQVSGLGRTSRVQHANASHLARLRRLGAKRRGEHDSQASNEGATVHRLVLTAGGMVGRTGDRQQG